MSFRKLILNNHIQKTDIISQCKIFYDGNEKWLYTKQTLNFSCKLQYVQEVLCLYIYIL